jgi:hypothetical protein
MQTVWVRAFGCQVSARCALKVPKRKNAWKVEWLRHEKSPSIGYFIAHLENVRNVMLFIRNMMRWYFGLRYEVT